MSKPPDHNIERAAKAWRLMLEFLMRSAPQRLRSQQKLGLTPNDSRALFSLDKAGKPIGMLAREWVCDPSTATWLADRLERAGLAERVPLAGDRRVKLVRVTKKGAATMKQLMAAYHQPPAEMTDIPSHDLDEVIRIFSKLHAQGS